MIMVTESRVIKSTLRGGYLWAYVPSALRPLEVRGV